MPRGHLWPRVICGLNSSKAEKGAHLYPSGICTVKIEVAVDLRLEEIAANSEDMFHIF
jgi:hypothetical protein